jgi:hypothetical protein
MRTAALVLLASLWGTADAAMAADSAVPLGDPVMDSPTLHCLGFYWVIRGDDNADAVVKTAWRCKGETAWRESMPLFRVERGAHARGGATEPAVPADAWLLACSIVGLEPDTACQVRLTLDDPDGGKAEKVLDCRTIGEPVEPAGQTILHVKPGDGGGAGTAADPIAGWAAAAEKAKAGTTVLFHAGTYPAPLTFRHGGLPGKPIVLRPAGDGEVIIDGAGGGKDGQHAGRGVDATARNHVWLEGLTIRNAGHAVVAHVSQGLVVRRCRMHDVEFGITANKNDDGRLGGFFITDNDMTGPSSWPRTMGIEDARGVQISGTQHVVAYNRIRGFADAIDTMPGPRCDSIDFHNNDLSELTDDGIEMDYSYRNTRCFDNRLTNVYHGISVQPVYGGPVYVFRNTMYNIEAAPFKMHSEPSGALMFHNTAVRAGDPVMIYSAKPVRNSVWRNNLFVGGQGKYAFESVSPMVDCDFDYCGFAGGPWGKFMKWNKQQYARIEDACANAPAMKHAVLVEWPGLFSSPVELPDDPRKQYPVEQDLRLSGQSAAADSAQRLPGFNDGFSGKGPDLGAFEAGHALPHYGPRPVGLAPSNHPPRQ